MKFGRRLWSDCRGAVSMSELLLINTIVIIGAIGGLSSIREDMVQLFGDMADALSSLDQSFTVNSSNYTAGYTDPGPFPVQIPGQPPAGLGFPDSGVPESP